MQAWGEALHNPKVAEFVLTAEAGLRAQIGAAVRRGQEQGRLDPGIDPDAAGRVVVAIVQGYVVQSAWTPELDRAAYREAARRLLDQKTER